MFCSRLCPVRPAALSHRVANAEAIPATCPSTRASPATAGSYAIYQNRTFRRTNGAMMTG
jgi:hypothetical protein